MNSPLVNQGVGHFTIYDDNSEDDPWSVLRKYVGLGIVEFVDMRGRPGAGSFGLQKNNLNTCFTDLRERYAELGLRWLAFTDVDEFVLSNNKGQLLTDLLNANYKGEACMEVGRTYYGTSFHHRRPRGLVTETYLLASPDYADGYPKMMANIYPEGPFQQNATGLFSVHTFNDQAAIPCRIRNSIKDIRINHYVRYVVPSMLLLVPPLNGVRPCVHLSGHRGHRSLTSRTSLLLGQVARGL